LTGLRQVPHPAPACSSDKIGKEISPVSRTGGRASTVAGSRTPMSTKDTGDDFDFDEFQQDGCSSLTRGQRLLRVLADTAGACRARWSRRAQQQPEVQGTQAPRRGEKMGRKRGRQQPRTASQKQQAHKAPAVGRPAWPAWHCPCGVALTTSMSLMLGVCILGRLNLDAIAWSPLLAQDDAAAAKASALTDTLEAEKGRLTLQHALLELESFQTKASDMATHPGIPDASKLKGFARDAKVLHGALQDLTPAEFPQVEDSYMQVLSSWASALAGAEAWLAGAGGARAGAA